MAPTGLTDLPTQVVARGRRTDVLSALRGAGSSLSAAEVAAQTGLHLNTARFHLDGLVHDGLATRASEPRTLPGRPRVLYAAQGDAGPRSYGLLAEMLVGLVASLDDAGSAATDAGRAWGRHLIDRTAPSESVDAATATARLARMFDATGFEPEVHTDKRNGVELRLRHCPFREVAERHENVVCAVHLGLIEGALAEIRAPLQAESLTPFVQPDLCVARLRATPASRPTGSAPRARPARRGSARR